jgi:hypothetical protein
MVVEGFCLTKFKKKKIGKKNCQYNPTTAAKIHVNTLFFSGS